MALLAGQWQIRDLVMGTGTPYTVVMDTNPFDRRVRATQSGPRAWNHGSWSGAEWQEEAVIPIRITIDVSEGPYGLIGEAATDAWLDAHQALVAAFAAIGDAVQDIELRFRYGSREFVMFGRPRMVESNLRLIHSGRSVTNAAFVALDPFTYSSELHCTDPINLPVQVSGLAVPFTVSPLAIPGSIVGGGSDIVNAGTAQTGLLIRIDGPVGQPTVILRRSDDAVQTMIINLDIPDGQFVQIDTSARTAFLNNVQTASVRGSIEGQFPILAPGENEIRFQADDFNDEASMTVCWRDAWF